MPPPAFAVLTVVLAVGLLGAGCGGGRPGGGQGSAAAPAAHGHAVTVRATTRRGTVTLSGAGPAPDRWVRYVTDVEVTG